MKFNLKDILVVIFFTLFLPLFLYNLGGFTLIDFDEAWYAEIARNILVNRDPFSLSFNQVPYSDHPPFGFILIAASFIIFGISEFSARFPSAALGFGSTVLLYFIAKNLFNRAIGIGAALMLTSSVWFMLRARSGNLDTVFLFFYLLTFYFAIKVKNNHKWIYPMFVSFALVNLTKSAIGFTLIIPIFFLFKVQKIRIKAKEIVISFCLFLAVIFPWFIVNYINFGFGFFKHIYQLGFRSESRMKPNLLEIGSSLTFQYLHFGIREWFYPALISLVGSAVFILKNRLLIPLYVWALILLFGFLTNAKTEIWHLIPLYPVLGLLISYFFFQSSSVFVRKVLKTSKKSTAKIISVVTVCLFTAFAIKQIYEFKNEVKLFDHEKSGLAQTAKAAQGLPEKLYLDGEFFLPQATFYSQKTVILAKGEGPPIDNLIGIVKYGQKPFLLLTELWRLNQDKIDTTKYEILKEYKGYVLIRVKN